MPARFDAYRMTDGKTPLSARYFNPVWQDLDLRLVELEALRVGWLEAVSQVSNLGLARINELVGAPMATVNEAIATLQSASLSASTSFTPSPVMATVFLCSFSACTSIRFWLGVTRPNTVYSSTAR